MIPKVNRPTFLKLVTNPSKSTENDPGAGSGGGMGYDGNPAANQPPENQPESNRSQDRSHDRSQSGAASVQINSQSESGDPHEKLQKVRANQVGLAKVFELFKSKLRGKKDDLASRYERSPGGSSGILLNKKAE